MPEIAISAEIYTRIKGFKQVAEAVLESDIDFEKCVELILEQGIDSMLADILGSVEYDTLLNSFQQLGAQYPEQVYGYVAETLRKGDAAQERERIKRKLGF
ncbi:hypothetical protein LM602_09010 [Candidatus Acetothermia bacterium]|jgi:thiamine pyrophosphokinase|nr:hypothetical protein [Candidatus Acetothermia bacterium]MCI2432661.1 hypothetical protein [Candidatus Acetothermia bacterium]MCI2435913.1 hypothetical protein [Candidatus Acetothermia bacterium]